MSHPAPVSIRHADRVALLTIDNPPVNALSAAVLAALADALDAAEVDPAVKVVVITGAGERAFAGGADIRELDAARAVDGGRALTELGQGVFDQIAGCRKPVIAAMNGVAFGGGLELALACHLRVCSERAQMGQTEINLGIMPGWGGTQRLPRLVGLSRALALILTGDRIGASEALRIGLVDRVAAPDAVLAEALELARRIAGKSAPAIESALLAVSRGLETPLDEGLHLEKELFIRQMGADDAREGFNAFFEKRPPTFTDK